MHRELLVRLPVGLLVLSIFLGSYHPVGSETSYNWKLDLDLGKVMPASSFPQPPPPGTGGPTPKAKQGHENGSGKAKVKSGADSGANIVSSFIPYSWPPIHFRIFYSSQFMKVFIFLV